MSIFATRVKEDETKLQERYQHLVQYAEILEVDARFMHEACKFDEGITSNKLDVFQKLIESYVFKADVFPNHGVMDTFSIDSQEHLDWYLKKRLEYHTELAAVRAQYEALINSIQSKANGLDYLFKAQAEAFVMDEYKRTGKKTTILPHGTAAVTTTKPTWKLEDENELQHWIDSLDPDSWDMYGISPKTYKRDLDKLKQQAEASARYNNPPPPGLKYDEGGDKVSLRLPKEKE